MFSSESATLVGRVGMTFSLPLSAIIFGLILESGSHQSTRHMADLTCHYHNQGFSAKLHKYKYTDTWLDLQPPRIQHSGTKPVFSILHDFLTAVTQRMHRGLIHPDCTRSLVIVYCYLARLSKTSTCESLYKEIYPSVLCFFFWSLSLSLSGYGGDG